VASLAGVKRDGCLGRRSPAQVSFSGNLLVGRPSRALPHPYCGQARKYGYEAAADQLGWACPIYVAETDERAREEAGRAVETLFNDFLRQTFEMLMPPGYTSMSSMKNFISMRRGLGGGKATAEGLIESGTALIGSPRTVLAGIERMRERTGNLFGGTVK
jgi:alkanesulfonate monooxygenase SsuD/methylene tetrahydromethanopterin reductase-like flavin-dependent oxidoreductase (luciferase family)